MRSKTTHPLAILGMSAIFIVAAFCKIGLMKLVILYLLLLPYLLQKQLDPKNLFKKITYIISAVFMLALLKIFYTNDSPQVIGQYGMRLFFVFSISMLSFSAIDFDKIFIYLMDTGKLKVVWGYSMLLSMNSLSLLKKEQERIAFNAKLRGLKWHQRYLTFFPLLVFAIRHSERGAMALVTRGISPDKEFYHVNYMEKRDRVTLISYFLLTLTFFLVG